MSIAELMWPYIERNVERLVRIYEEADPKGREWKPPAAESNSLAALVNHTLSNAEDNLLGTVLGAQIEYERQADFDSPELDADAVRDHWRAIRTQFEGGLSTLSDQDLLAQVTHPRRGGVTRFETMLVVARHTSEHLAHAELTRDLYRASVQA